MGTSVRYIQDDHVENGIITQIDVSDPMEPPQFEVSFKDGRKCRCTREHIKLLNDPEHFAIPTKATQMLEVTRTLTQEQIDSLTNPEPMTPLQKLWVQWHEVLDHLPFPIMSRYITARILPKKFSVLKY